MISSSVTPLLLLPSIFLSKVKRANRKPEALQYCYSYEKEEEWAAEDEMVRWHH